MGLNPDTFYDDIEDFTDKRKDQGRQNYQFKAALPLFGKYNVTRDEVQYARQNATPGTDFLAGLKLATGFPMWFFADKDATLKSAEHLLDADRLVKSPAFGKFLECAARGEGMTAAMVFTVPGHGRWVMHNRGGDYRFRPLYLVIPSYDGITRDMHVMKYDNYIREIVE